jgi:hypothetical protein
LPSGADSDTNDGRKHDSGQRQKGISMKHLSLLAAGIAAIAITAACSKGPEQRQPGMYETTAKITSLQLTGAPPEVQARANTQVGQSRSTSECLTAEQARDPLAQMRQMMAQQGATANCRFSDQTFSGGTIRVHATCPAAAGGSAEVSLEGSFTETTMQATMTMNAQGPASAAMPGVTGMRIVAESMSRRTGDCPGAAH